MSFLRLYFEALYLVGEQLDCEWGQTGFVGSLPVRKIEKRIHKPNFEKVSAFLLNAVTNSGQQIRQHLDLSLEL